MLPKFNFVHNCIDDVIISEKALNECHENTCKVLDRVRALSIMAKLKKKCKFFSCEVEYLGHKI